MFCPECGNQVDDFHNFCPICGYAITEMSETISANGKRPSHSENRCWYFRENNEEYGPYSKQEMIDFVYSGEIVEKTLVYKEGKKNWVKAEKTFLWEEIYHYKEEVAYEKISDIWLWLMGTIPILLYVVLTAFRLQIFGLIAYGALLILFMLLDERETAKYYKDTDPAIFIISLIIPLVYLFARPAKTSKNYVPAVIWILIFVLLVIPINIVMIGKTNQNLQFSSIDAEFFYDLYGMGGR